jgi:hypothetical protein
MRAFSDASAFNDESARRPLQNRVDPFGDLVSTSARGLLMGNRGGRFHGAEAKLGKRRWASRQWIVCVCEFKGRQRKVWGNGYTELFFLDEPTAFGAGHRPCFECRRQDANAFRAAWAASWRCRTAPSAPQMDIALHRERLVGRVKRRHVFVLDDVPDGAMVAHAGRAYAVRGERLLPWSFEGYAASVPRPAGMIVEVLTPPSILKVLANGYQPLWHPSAELAMPLPPLSQAVRDRARLAERPDIDAVPARAILAPAGATR